MMLHGTAHFDVVKKAEIFPHSWVPWVVYSLFYRLLLLTFVPSYSSSLDATCVSGAAGSLSWLACDNVTLLQAIPYFCLFKGIGWVALIHRVIKRNSGGDAVIMVLACFRHYASLTDLPRGSFCALSTPVPTLACHCGAL